MIINQTLNKWHRLGTCGVVRARDGACANASAILRPAVVLGSPDAGAETTVC